MMRILEPLLLQDELVCPSIYVCMYVCIVCVFVCCVCVCTVHTHTECVYIYTHIVYEHGRSTGGDMRAGTGV